MTQRSIELMVTFVIKVPEGQIAQLHLDDFEDWLDSGKYSYFYNRCSQKDGRKVTLRLDYKRPPNA